MRLFLRDQLPVAVIYFLQLGLSALIYWLHGFQNGDATGYVITVSTFLFVVYLGYKYYTNQGIYRRLSDLPQSLDHTFDSKSKVLSPMDEALQSYTQKQFQYYQNELFQVENKLDEHLHFMNQWVHQMKTPISVIYMTIQDEDEPIFDSIREETDRLEKGLETVLYMARLDSFEKDYSVEQVSLNSIVSRFVQENKRLFIRNQVFPRVDIDSGLTVLSDEKWLGFIFGQLMTNAVKYSTGFAQSIQVRAYKDGNTIVLEVEDLGIGIPKHDIQRIFEPYFTGDNGRKYPAATGMGLYLVKEICGRLGHRVEAVSEPGQGTTLRLRFQTAADPNG